MPGLGGGGIVESESSYLDFTAFSRLESVAFVMSILAQYFISSLEKIQVHSIILHVDNIVYPNKADDGSCSRAICLRVILIKHFIKDDISLNSSNLSRFEFFQKQNFIIKTVLRNIY